MARGPVRTPEERRTLYLLEMAGYTYAEVNEIMGALGYRHVPMSTYTANMRNEVPLFRRRPDVFKSYCLHPVPYGNWPGSWKQEISFR